ncbi:MULTISPECIES: ferritin family protein [unclassified Methanoculleus]|uniref:ferritin family protein n=1 Tax=unclassified Methanoculleus TaxID=2619537 RepID=UPI0025FBA29D|nr:MULTISPECIES: ferritin family protein [unclassified Methanoculleus]MCK9318499.1 rubrerythrin [Methanoculleus sp.]MDD2253565.1 ferritin family protein [Methanoculleus sp.]MDD2788864.1 ferritin family protein [Methanoculleus sp.]MDD3215147.1 ferritin family protein [Methanoculleus sp.]MDD4313160.1 ferritin family protein [Methanoculleus sp.]
MPEFSHPFAGNHMERRLDRGELIRAIRFSIAAEYEAIQLYDQIAESTDDPLVRKVMRDIANEEKEHAGEFLRLLREIDPDEEGFYRHGYAEVEEMIGEVKKGGE